MEIQILTEDTNPLLHRTDVRFEITHEEESPSRLSVRDSLAAKLDKDSDEVVVHELNTAFGMRQTAGYAKVYDSPAEATEIEAEYMLERNKITAGEEADGDAESQEAAE